MLILVLFVSCAFVTFCSGVSYVPPKSPLLRCPYGKYHNDVGGDPICSLLGVTCPKGYFCSGDNKNQNGFCCKTHNPCITGNPYNVRGDAPPCRKGNFRCPIGYSCVGTAISSSVCCPVSDGRPGHTGVRCLADGRTYQVGDTFRNRAGDRCTCQYSGRSTCVSHPIPASSVYCRYLNRQYTTGQRFVAADGCNECRCRSDGTVRCTDQSRCHVDSSSSRLYCTYHGERYLAGRNFPASDGCNECTCRMDATYTCTSSPCHRRQDRRDGSPTSGQVYCTYEGIHYSRGQSFSHSDGCNRCSCGRDGRVNCTTRSCRAPRVIDDHGHGHGHSHK
ncbi:kielin/chordin-like protein [Ostrea edulis]|uniref:kielin/chordin-like protein n=1 Tax=Ostrea edulis TaxID=37623 RepID=UPI0024AF90A4|nr:kielin/chordin-like protein [Ostrea edulis]